MKKMKSKDKDLFLLEQPAGTKKDSITSFNTDSSYSYKSIPIQSFG